MGRQVINCGFAVLKGWWGRIFQCFQNVYRISTRKTFKHHIIFCVM